MIIVEFNGKNCFAKEMGIIHWISSHFHFKMESWNELIVPVPSASAGAGACVPAACAHTNIVDFN